MWWTSAATTKIICVVKGSTAKKKPGGATLTGPTLQFVGRVRRSRHPAINNSLQHPLTPFNAVHPQRTFFPRR
ncbi:hypothetical protein AM352_18775 [Citrobacter koseri]|nr:hypothetical protein AM352_18775 [Citrobacter koseri]PWY08940.1 hypothetical protein DL345_04565 [Citrobacter koseri]